MPEDCRQHVGRWIVRSWSRKEFARAVNESNQSSFAMKEMIGPNIEGRIRERCAQGVNKNERETDNQPEGQIETSDFRLFRGDIKVPTCDCERNGETPRGGVFKSPEPRTNEDYEIEEQQPIAKFDTRPEVSRARCKREMRFIDCSLRMADVRFCELAHRINKSVRDLARSGLYSAAWMIFCTTFCQVRSMECSFSSPFSPMRRALSRSRYKVSSAVAIACGLGSTMRPLHSCSNNSVAPPLSLVTTSGF